MKEWFKSPVLALSAAASIFLSPDVIADPVAPQIGNIQKETRVQVAMATQADPLMVLVKAKESGNETKKASSPNEIVALQTPSENSSSSILHEIIGLSQFFPQEKAKIIQVGQQLIEFVKEHPESNTYPGWFILDLKTWRDIGIVEQDLKNQLSKWEKWSNPKKS